jgi:hypothetical protein
MDSTIIGPFLIQFKPGSLTLFSLSFVRFLTRPGWSHILSSTTSHEKKLISRLELPTKGPGEINLASSASC